MPRRFGNYSQLFQRIEEEFDIEDITTANLQDFLGVDTDGRLGLADELARVSELNKDIKSFDDIDQLNQLKREILSLPIKRQELLNKTNEKIERLTIEERERVIAEGIAQLQDFADEKNITLGDTRVGRQEVWNGKDVLTVRDSKGRFVTWRPS